MSSILDRIPDGHELATYNSERARGLIHTDEWHQRMARAQEAFDAARRAEIHAEAAKARAAGATVIETEGGGLLIIPPSYQPRWWWPLARRSR